MFLDQLLWLEMATYKAVLSTQRIFGKEKAMQMFQQTSWQKDY